MDLNKYFIPIPESEGVLEHLSRLTPNREIRSRIESDVQKKIIALESYVDVLMSELVEPYAMEGTIDSDRTTKIAEKGRMAGQKIKEGKRTNNQALINQGMNELRSSTNELNSEVRRANNPEKKKKLAKIAAILAAVTAGALLVFGIRKVTSLDKQNKQLEQENLNQMKQNTAQLQQMEHQLQTMRDSCEERIAESEELLEQHEATAGRFRDLNKQQNKKLDQLQRDIKDPRITMRMPDGSIKKFESLDAAMKAGGTLIIG